MWGGCGTHNFFYCAPDGGSNLRSLGEESNPLPNEPPPSPLSFTALQWFELTRGGNVQQRPACRQDRVSRSPPGPVLHCSTAIAASSSDPVNTAVTVPIKVCHSMTMIIMKVLIRCKILSSRTIQRSHTHPRTQTDSRTYEETIHYYNPNLNKL